MNNPSPVFESTMLIYIAGGLLAIAMSLFLIALNISERNHNKKV